MLRSKYIAINIQVVMHQQEFMHTKQQ